MHRLRDAAEMAQRTAAAIGVPTKQVLVASTGVIGARLPMPRIRRGIRAAADELERSGLRDAAEAIRALVEHGADVNARDAFSNRTPLMFASHRGALEATRALVFADADLTATTAVKDYVEIVAANSAEQAQHAAASATPGFVPKDVAR